MLTPILTLQQYHTAAEHLKETATLRFKTDASGIAVTRWERFQVAFCDLFSFANTVATRKAKVLSAFLDTANKAQSNISQSTILTIYGDQKKLSSRTVKEVMAGLNLNANNTSPPAQTPPYCGTENPDTGIPSKPSESRHETPHQAQPAVHDNILPATENSAQTDIPPEAEAEAEVELEPKISPDLNANLAPTKSDTQCEVPSDAQPMDLTDLVPKTLAKAQHEVQPDIRPNFPPAKANTQNDAPSNAPAKVQADIPPKAELEPELEPEPKISPNLNANLPPSKSITQCDVPSNAQPKAQTDLPPTATREIEPDLRPAETEQASGLQPPVAPNTAREAIPETEGEATPAPASDAASDPTSQAGLASGLQGRRFRPATVQRSRAPGAAAEKEITYAKRLTSNEIATLHNFAGDLLLYAKQNAVANQALWGRDFQKQLLDILTALNTPNALASARPALDLEAMTLNDRAIEPNVLQTLQSVATRLRDKQRPAASSQASALVAPFIRAELNRRAREHYTEQHPLPEAITPTLQKLGESTATAFAKALLGELDKIETLRARRKAAALTTPDMQALRQQLVTQLSDHATTVRTILNQNLPEGAHKTAVLSACLELDRNTRYAEAEKFAQGLKDIGQAPEASTDGLLALLDASQGQSRSERRLGLLLFAAQATPESLSRLKTGLDTQAEALAGDQQTPLRQGMREFILTNLREDFRLLADAAEDR